MSTKTIEKRTKRSWSLCLMLHKGRYKARITTDEALFYQSYTTGKTKIQYIRSKSVAKMQHLAKGKLAVKVYSMEGNVLSRLNKIFYRTKG